MKIFLPAPTDEDLNFGSEFDALQRKSIADGLTNLVLSIDQPIVCAIDGPWGTGKTVFLKMWKRSLDVAGIPVIFFDAFANDFQPDAFLALSSEILSQARSKKAAPAEKIAKFRRGAFNVGKIILKGGLKIGVRAATAGILRIEDFGDAEDVIADQTNSIADAYIDSILETHESSLSAIEEFKHSLELLAQSTDKSKIVVIIDELDRCRPDYSLNLLERIKHFFSVDGVHFFLGANLAQIENIVKSRYGSEIDATTYLRKFIKLSVQIENETQHSPGEISDYINYVSIKLGFLENKHSTASQVSSIISTLKFFGRYHNLTFRDIDQIMSNISLVLIFTPKMNDSFASITAGLCCLKHENRELFMKAKRGHFSLADGMDYFIDTRGLPLRSEDASEMQWQHKLWKYCLDPNLSPDEEREFRGILGGNSIPERRGIVRRIARDVVDRISARQ